MKQSTLDELVIPFVRKARKINQPIYAGIDSGSTGAIGFICGRYHTVVDIPTTATTRARGKKKSSKFDHVEIIRLFDLIDRSECAVRVLIETALSRVGGFGRGASFVAFKVGMAYAMWPLFLKSRDYAVMEVYPHVWKGKANIPGGLDGKEVARSRAVKLFPSAMLHRKKDHNRAEALLLAKYAKESIYA